MLTQSEHLVLVLAGPISHTSTQYILSIFYISRICLPSILLILMGVELPVYIVITLS